MKILLVYFSGCGYTFWAAQKIASLLSAQGHTVSGVLNLEQYAPAEQESSDRHVFLTPTYFFAPPALVAKALNKIPMVADKQAVVIATNGGHQGLTTIYVRDVLKSRGYQVFGTAELLMPDSIPTQKSDGQLLERMKKAEDSLKDLCAKIVGTEPFSCDRSRAYGFLALPFLKILRHAVGLSFISTAACTHCGLCERECPMHCITLKDGRPRWTKNCTTCFRCVNRCPAQAVDISLVSWILGACGAVVGFFAAHILFGWLWAFFNILIALVAMLYGGVAGVAIGQKIYLKISQIPLMSKRRRVPCEKIKKGL